MTTRNMLAPGSETRKVSAQTSSSAREHSTRRLRRKQNHVSKASRVPRQFLAMLTLDVLKMKHKRMSMGTMVTWKALQETSYENLG